MSDLGLTLLAVGTASAGALLVAWICVTGIRIYVEQSESLKQLSEADREVYKQRVQFDAKRKDVGL